MIRGGRVPDLPGVKYHLLRMKKDFNTFENIDRTNRRSKYGIKSPFKRYDILNKRLTNKANYSKKLRDLKNPVVSTNENPSITILHNITPYTFLSL